MDTRILYFQKYEHLFYLLKKNCWHQYIIHYYNYTTHIITHTYTCIRYDVFYGHFINHKIILFDKKINHVH